MGILFILLLLLVLFLLLFFIELTQSKTILENTVEIEPQPVALDFKNLLNIIAVPSKAVF